MSLWHLYDVHPNLLAWLVMVAVVAGVFVVPLTAWLCGTNSRVDAAQDAAREAELQEIVEAGGRRG